MSIGNVQSRISEIQAQIQALRQNQPAQMFESLLQQKLGVSPTEETGDSTAAANSDAAGTYNAVNDANAALMLQALQQAVNGQTMQNAADYTWNGVLPEGFEKAAPYMEYVQEASERYGMPVNLILGIMRAESDFNNDCVSYAGAKGLMQLMPETAAEVGVTDEFDPRQNILGAVEYVTKLINRYDGDVKLALAAYNTGPGKIASRGVTSSDSEAYLTVPQSIRDYADRVLRYAGYSL